MSPQLLRSRSLGQIDLASVTKDQAGCWLIEMAEVKSSHVGGEAMERTQTRRLQSAQQFLSALLGMRARFIKIVG